MFEPLESRRMLCAVTLGVAGAGVLDVTGTPMNDAIRVFKNAAATLQVTCGGVSFGVFPDAAVTSISVRAMGGNDLVALPPTAAGPVLDPATLCGGPGDDRLEGGLGDDLLLGEAGDDTLHGHGGNDQLFGGDGNDLLQGFAGNDMLMGETGDDTLAGDGGDDFMSGGDDDDDLVGGAGADALFGDAGFDVLDAVDGAADLIIDPGPGGYIVIKDGT